MMLFSMRVCGTCLRGVIVAMVSALPWHGEPLPVYFVRASALVLMVTPQSNTISPSACFEAFAISARRLYPNLHLLASKLAICLAFLSCAAREAWYTLRYVKLCVRGTPQQYAV